MPNPIFDAVVESVVGTVLGGSNNDFIPTDRMNKALEERGYIEFVYGKAIGTLPGLQTTILPSIFGGININTPEYPSTRTSRRLPFFEDPSIKEIGGANYAENRVLMRNEPVRQFIDVRPVQYHMEMLYTLPHISKFMKTMPMEVDEWAEINKFRERIINTIEEDFKRTGAERNTTVKTQNGFPVGTVIKSDIYEGPRMPVESNVDLGDSVIENYFYNLARDPQAFKQSEIYGYIHYLMNLVRTSIRTSVGLPSSAKYGPPIAVLKFGGVYNRVPCIVKSYKIELRPDYGNDNASLYPRVIRVRLELEEFRQTHGTLHGEGNDYPYGWDDIILEGGVPKGKV